MFIIGITVAVACVLREKGKEKVFLNYDLEFKIRITIVKPVLCNVST
jgi:hypothetical protein